MVRHMFSVLRGSRRIGSPSHVHASQRSDAVKTGRKRNKVNGYKIRELHFRKEGRDEPDEDPARNHLWLEYT